MRFLTTTRPPEGILAHDLGIEWSPPAFFRRDPGTPEEAAGIVIAQILDAIRQGARSVTLRDWANDTVLPVAANREWWVQATEQLAKQLSGLDTRLDAIVVDHARYPGRRSDEEQQWQADCLADLISITDRFGAYGVPQYGPTIWTNAAEFGWRGAAIYSVHDVPWLIMPGQHRNSAPPPTVLEFAGVVDHVIRLGMDTCVVWSDPGIDQFGRWKTRPDDWHALLTVAALVRGRRVEVPQWEPPAWLPPVAAPAKQPSGGAGHKVFAASIEEVQP